MKKSIEWRHALRLLFQALALSFIQIPGAFAQQEPAVKLKIDTELVNLNVVVTDKSGQRVRGLVKDDFEVFEDGVKQEISHFVAQERPLKLVLLFDTSISMKEVLPAVKRAGVKMVEDFSDDDRLSVISFASEVRLHAEWVEKGKAIDAIKLLEPEPHRTVQLPVTHEDLPIYDNNTYLFEAFRYVFDMLRNNRDRVAVITFSDGIDTGGGRVISNQRKRVEELGSETKSQAEESWAIVYPIRFKTNQLAGKYPESARRFPISIGIKIGGPPKHPGTEFLSELAAASGGRLFEFTGEEDLARSIQEVLLDLRSQYAIAYTPPDAGPRKGFHRIKVLVKKPGLIARTRGGYLVTR
jgi:Ca-activated chloride channel homolog